MPPEEKKPPQNTRPSGEHAAVKGFRAKMESIADGEAGGGLAGLDASLDAYLTEMRSDPPEAPEPTAPLQTPCVVDAKRFGACDRGTGGCNIAHGLEETKVTIRMSPLCRHGVSCAKCEKCSPP